MVGRMRMCVRCEFVKCYLELKALSYSTLHCQKILINAQRVHTKLDTILDTNDECSHETKASRKKTKRFKLKDLRFAGDYTNEEEKSLDKVLCF